MDWELERIEKPNEDGAWYKEHEPDAAVMVLGQEYGIYMNVPEEADETLRSCSGYCDKTSKRIVIEKLGCTCNLGDPIQYIKYVLRHEIIHAFLFESGISGDTTWQIDGQEHPEQMVEWIGMQFPKMLKAFEEVDAL